MPRIQVIVSNELVKALRDESERTGASMSALMRRYAEKALEENGVKVDEKLRWGGRRDTPHEKKQRGKKPA